MTPFDCELLRAGLLAQPVNSISALAFVLAGVALWRRRPDASAFAVAAGLGSVWFHASPGGAASWAHDISQYALIALAAIEVWRRFASRQLPVFAIALFLVGIAFWYVGRTGSPLCAADSVLQWHAAWHVTAAGAVSVLFSADVISPPDQ